MKRTDIYREMLKEEEENRIKYANLKKVIELQQKYVALLVKAYNETFAIAHIHHYRPNKKDLEEGERLRKEIAKETKKIKNACQPKKK